MLGTWLEIAEHTAPLPDSESAQPSGTGQLLSAPYRLTCPAILVLNLNKTQIFYLLLFVFLPIFYFLKFKSNLCIFVIFPEWSSWVWGPGHTGLSNYVFYTKKAELLLWQSVKNFYWSYFGSHRVTVSPQQEKKTFIWFVSPVCESAAPPTCWRFYLQTMLFFQRGSLLGLEVILDPWRSFLPDLSASPSQGASIDWNWDVCLSCLIGPSQTVSSTVSLPLSGLLALETVNMDSCAGLAFLSKSPLDLIEGNSEQPLCGMVMKVL